MAVLKLSSEENIIPDEALGPDAWNERSWEKDNRDKTWKSWATWNLILSSKSKSHLTSFIDESEPWHVRLYTEKEFKTKIRVPAQFGNKKNDTAPRRISLSRFNFHDRNKRESKEDTVVYINELKQDGNSGLCFILLIAILRALVCWIAKNILAVTQFYL